MRTFTASYSWAARHFSADTFSCSENPSLNSLMWTGRMAPCNEHKSLLLFEHWKIKTHFRLDSNQHLRIISSAFYHLTTCPWRTQSRLQLVSFYGAGYRSRTGDFSMARRRVAATPNPHKPTRLAKHSWLLRTCMLIGHIKDGRQCLNLTSYLLYVKEML